MKIHNCIDAKTICLRNFQSPEEGVLRFTALPCSLTLLFLKLASLVSEEKTASGSPFQQDEKGN